MSHAEEAGAEQGAGPEALARQRLEDTDLLTRLALVRHGIPFHAAFELAPDEPFPLDASWALTFTVGLGMVTYHKLLRRFEWCAAGLRSGEKMRNQNLKWTICLVAVLLSCSMATHSFGKNDRDLQRSVIRKIDEIRARRSSQERTDAAEGVFWTINRNPNHSGFDGQVIDNLISLLGDNDDAVRFWAAASLGVLGSRATRAVPALERVLEERECIGLDLSSSATISRALEKITGHEKLPNWEKCTQTNK